MGISYDFIELFTEYLRLSSTEKDTFKNSCSADAWVEFEKSAALARSVHKRNAHKLDYPHNINILPVLTPDDLEE